MNEGVVGDMKALGVREAFKSKLQVNFEIRGVRERFKWPVEYSYLQGLFTAWSKVLVWRFFLLMVDAPWCPDWSRTFAELSTLALTLTSRA